MLQPHQRGPVLSQRQRDSSVNLTPKQQHKEERSTDAPKAKMKMVLFWAGQAEECSDVPTVKSAALIEAVVPR